MEQCRTKNTNKENQKQDRERDPRQKSYPTIALSPLCHTCLPAAVSPLGRGAPSIITPPSLPPLPE